MARTTPYLIANRFRMVSLCLIQGQMKQPRSYPMRPYLMTFRRFLAVALWVLVCQACTSRGPTPSAGGTSASADPGLGYTGDTWTRGGAAGPSPGYGGEVSAPGAAAGGPVVPAVVGLPPVPSGNATYRIGPHDLLEIEVFDVEELSSEERVSDGGAIVIPLIGAVKVGGLTPREALATATVYAADHLGLSEKIGTLSSGKYADVIAMSDNPLKDVRAAEKVVFVMKGGLVVKQRGAKSHVGKTHDE